MDAAILREKRLKEWRRLWKIRLIESMSLEWIDLFDVRTGESLDGPPTCRGIVEREVSGAMHGSRAFGPRRAAPQACTG